MNISADLQQEYAHSIVLIDALMDNPRSRSIICGHNVVSAPENGQDCLCSHDNREYMMNIEATLDAWKKMSDDTWRASLC